MSRFKLQHICKLQIYILQSILFTFHDKHNICFDIPQRVTTFSKGVLMERMKGQLKLSIVDIVTWTNCPLTIGPEWDRFYFKKIKGKVLKSFRHDRFLRNANSQRVSPLNEGGVKGQGRGCGRASEEPKCGVIQSGPISDSPVTMDQTPLTAVCPGASPLSDISPEKKKKKIFVVSCQETRYSNSFKRSHALWSVLRGDTCLRGQLKTFMRGKYQCQKKRRKAKFQGGSDCDDDDVVEAHFVCATV